MIDDIRLNPLSNDYDPDAVQEIDMRISTANYEKLQAAADRGAGLEKYFKKSSDLVGELLMLMREQKLSPNGDWVERMTKLEQFVESIADRTKDRECRICHMDGDEPPTNCPGPHKPLDLASDDAVEAFSEIVSEARQLRETGEAR